MKLFIVESPGKVKKIQGFLGSDWKVAASVGHVRDLPERELGVSMPDFVPDYAPTERGKDVLKRLAALVKDAEAVYLATDPDREGEAIAWHLQEALKLKNPRRVTYGSITESVVKAAIQAPRSLDMALVKAQEARRVLDRLCGYTVSGPLSRVAKERLSAGRVQSPALRLVVEREKAIRNFTSVMHFGAELSFDGGWKAVWNTKPWLPDGAEYLLDENLAVRASALRSLTVDGCEEKESKVSPPAPFTTSSLQQAASNALKFSPKHTMELAQRLYESGLITYMRTDSPNLSEEAIVEIRQYCSGKNWPLSAKPRVWKSKDGAQEAHEAIRPTHAVVEDTGETDDEKALYRLIRIRALASQLADAVYDVRTLRLSAPLEGKKAEFEARGRVLKEQGWKILLIADETDAATDDEEADAPENPVPALVAGSSIIAVDGEALIKKTRPPARYTEASLVRELENRGIGRPATYAAIVDTIMRREYVKTEKRRLAPTVLGEKAVELLVGAFSFSDYEFTRDMENSLDDIAGGKASYRDVLAGAYERLQGELSSFLSRYGVSAQPRPEPEQTAFTCEKCGKPLIHMKGQKKDGSGEYDFFSCSDRKCNASYPNEDGKPGAAKRKPEPTKFKCKACGKPLVRRESAKGPFFGCSGYPDCKRTYQDKDGKPDFGGKKK
jgi:DNA topoisomerase-1